MDAHCARAGVTMERRDAGHFSHALHARLERVQERGIAAPPAAAPPTPARRRWPRWLLRPHERGWFFVLLPLLSAGGALAGGEAAKAIFGTG